MRPSSSADPDGRDQFDPEIRSYPAIDSIPLQVFNGGHIKTVNDPSSTITDSF